MKSGRFKIIVGTILLLPLFSYKLVVQSEKQKRPNVLLICIDDLRSDLGCYGNEIIKTPNIDKLASNAGLFKNHYVQTAICGPSRTSLLTGKIQQRWDMWAEYRANGIEPDKPLVFPQIFKNNGYNTVGIGKISHEPGGVMDEKQMIPQIPFAWDTCYTAVGKWKTPWNAFFAFANGDSHNTAMGIGMETPRIPYESGAVGDEGYPDGLNANEAVTQLGRLKKEGKPFFLSVGFFKPHLPFNAPKKYWDMYDRDKILVSNNNDLPPSNIREYSINYSEEVTRHYPWPEGAGVVGEERAKDLKHGYYACVSYIDTQIGKILDELKKQELENNTIVVLWSDHGWHLGEHGMFGKMTNYDVATNSPLIIKVPGITDGGMVLDGMVETVDVYPTLANLCGLDYPTDLDGQTLVSMLQDPGVEVKPYARSYFYRNNAIGKTIRTNRYRIVHWTTESDSTVAIELYDHFNDPTESVNLASENKDMVVKLLKQLDNASFMSPGHKFGWEYFR